MGIIELTTESASVPYAVKASQLERHWTNTSIVTGNSSLTVKYVDWFPF